MYQRWNFNTNKYPQIADIYKIFKEVLKATKNSYSIDGVAKQPIKFD